MGRAVSQYNHCTSDTARRLGAKGSQGAQALGLWNRRKGRAGTRGERARGASGRGARPGLAAGLWALHLVHSAYF